MRWRWSGAEFLGLYPIGYHRQLVGWYLKHPLHLVPHVFTTHNNPPGLICQPPFHAADVPLHVVVETLVAPGLGGVNGGHQGDLVGVLESAAGKGYQPIMAVDKVEGAVFLHQDNGILQHL